MCYFSAAARPGKLVWESNLDCVQFGPDRLQLWVDPSLAPGTLCLVQPKPKPLALLLKLSRGFWQIVIYAKATILTMINLPLIYCGVSGPPCLKVLAMLVLGLGFKPSLPVLWRVGIVHLFNGQKSWVVLSA